MGAEIVKGFRMVYILYRILYAEIFIASVSLPRVGA